MEEKLPSLDELIAQAEAEKEKSKKTTSKKSEDERIIDLARW